VWLADGIGFRAELTHPEALAARAQRSEALLVAIAVACAAAAVGLSLTWFSRARAARRTGELRTSFVAAVSHELRTPIASVRMLAELLEEDRVDEAERAEVHEALAREARRLGETVDRLLGFSRMAAGKVVLDRATIPLADPVERAVERFRDRCPEQAVECELDRSVVAFVDPAQVELVVDNLLGNAKKYAPLGTPYRVKVDADGAYARLTITDRGPGIPRRDQRRIFEPFERVDDRLSKATEGSGIGLSLVAHAARAHGGGAWVESDEGRGATFVVTFPRAEGAPARRADARADEEASDAEDDDIESEDGRGDA
jgi:signal transduction histidine kinase